MKATPLAVSCRRLSWILTAVIIMGGFSTARSAPPEAVFQVVMLEDADEDPAACGRAAAEKLLAQMGDVPLKAVIISECFEDLEYKQQLLDGITALIDVEKVFGAATYGSFTGQACADFDSVCLLGIGGAVDVAAALTTEMGTAKLQPDQDLPLIQKRLRAAGEKLAQGLGRTEWDRLCLVLADAHSPKNQYLVEGVQQALGKQFPITGGCANKNAGQTYIYYQGRPYQDAALALMLAGDFSVTLAGRFANQQADVIASARQGAATVVEQAGPSPWALLAFNCAGRRSKLDRYEDELEAIRQGLGQTQVPLFGCYCAGEIGPVDTEEKKPDALSGGSGWHLMFTLIGPAEK